MGGPSASGFGRAPRRDGRRSLDPARARPPPIHGRRAAGPARGDGRRLALPRIDDGGHRPRPARRRPGPTPSYSSTSVPNSAAAEEEEGEAAQERDRAPHSRRPHRGREAGRGAEEGGGRRGGRLLHLLRRGRPRRLRSEGLPQGVPSRLRQAGRGLLPGAQQVELRLAHMQQLREGRGALHVLHLHILRLQSLHQARQVLQRQGEQGLLRHLLRHYSVGRGKR